MMKNLTAEQKAELIEKGRQLVGKKKLTPEEMVELMKTYRQLEKEGDPMEKIFEMLDLNPEESLIL
jgi:hypothetical protein